MKEGYADNRFASLYYKELGQGVPLVMLHGNGESHQIFGRLSELMSRHYRVILMDSRGHGASKLKDTVRAQELTTSSMADDVVQVMDVLHVPKAVILGFSDGANVALEAASPRPRFTGTASDVADGLQLWFEQHAADGFIIQGGTPETFPRFVDEVVPLLQARGLFRCDYPGTTLRESLGLALPANQFQK